MPQTWSDESRHFDRRMALVREWDDLVDQARRLPGFEDFLRPPSLDSLLPAAADGPVVIINVSRWRCDALIVTSSGVQAVELAGLSLDEVIDRSESYLRTVSGLQDAALTVQAVAGAGGAGTATDSTALDKAMQTYRLEVVDLEQRLGVVLRWCWDRIAGPVLARLGIAGPPAPGTPWPRLWWCPTGPLTLLPLHAAGHHENAGDAVIDRVVSSYTPTLQALVQARSPHRTATQAAGVRDALLVVAMPETPAQPPLPNVTRELDVLLGLDGIDSTVLQGQAATIGAVRDALATHRWVHLSCHGDQNLNDPSRGGVLLADGMLTITDISGGRYHGDLAFLSACKTATGGTTLPDEAITLAAGLHYTGYRHVIATLWSIWDDSAPEITAAVYEAIADGAMLRAERAAEALHHAVRALREERWGEPSVWIPFTHTGP